MLYSNILLLQVTYQSLCPTKRVTVKLDNGEYRPNHYVEVTCANNYAPLPPRLQNYDNYNYRSNELPLLRALLNERSGEKREVRILNIGKNLSNLKNSLELSQQNSLELSQTKLTDCELGIVLYILSKFYLNRYTIS